MREAATHQRLGLRLERLGVELALDQPLHRAVRVRLERRGREPVACAQLRQNLLGLEPLGEPRRAPRSGKRERPAPLGLGRRCVRPPRHVGERPGAGHALDRVGVELVEDVFDQERANRGRALLVGLAPREHQQPLRARHARVEEVALACRPVVPHRQREPAGPRQLAPLVVRQERLGTRRARELALLEPAHEDGLEPAGPDRLRPRDLHAVGRGIGAEEDGELREEVVERLPIGG